MTLLQLNESIKQYDLDNLLLSIRNNHYFYAENNLRGPSSFEDGYCYEFALAFYNFLKSQGESPELIFLVGNMKKADAEWYDTTDFDPTTEHPFHTIVKVRKFYYDINGKLGNKREILARWYKFRRKKLLPIEPNVLNPYIKNHQLVKTLENLFKINK